MLKSSIVLRRPMDAHAHFRDGEILRAVVPYTAGICDIALAMPNLKPPITTLEELRAYHAEIMSIARPVNPDFRPVLTLYLTDNLSPDVVEAAHIGDNELGRLAHGVKWYPKGATTNSDDGVTDTKTVYPVLERMQEIGMVLNLHGEVTHWNGIELPQHEREDVYVREVLPVLRRDFPGLKIVLEHVSTRAGVEFVENDTTGNLATTITPQHLMLTAADLFRGGLRVHGVCMPIVKNHNDRVAIRNAALSGASCFFAGTDSAPHLLRNKESRCCAFGAFTAPAMLELYAEVWHEDRGFETEAGRVAFERFMSLNGPAFYGIEPSKRSITLTRGLWEPIFIINTRASREELTAFADCRAGFVTQLNYRANR